MTCEYCQGAEGLFPYTTYPKVAVPVCPACGRQTTAVTSQTDRYGFRIQTATCVCGLEYLAERLDRAGYAEFYAGPYRALVLREALKPTAEHASRLRAASEWQYVHATLPRLVPHRALFATPAPASVLDVGGSTGYTLACFRTQLFPAQTRGAVLDPCRSELDVAARTYGFTGYQGLAEDRLPLGPFTGVLCLETADHLCEPAQAFCWMASITQPGGWLLADIVDAPARQRLGRLVHKIDHPLQWSTSAFLGLLERAGWHVERHWPLGRFRTMVFARVG